MSEVDIGRLVTAGVPPEIVIVPYSMCRGPMWVVGSDESSSKRILEGAQAVEHMSRVKAALRSRAYGEYVPCIPSLLLLDEVHELKNTSSATHRFWS